MPTLRNTAERNSIAADLVALTAQGSSAITQLLAVKQNLLSLRATAATSEAAEDGDLAEVDLTIASLAEAVRTDVLG